MNLSVKMLNVKEDKQVNIQKNNTLITILDKEGERLYFKLFTLETVDQEFTNIINNHIYKGFVILSIDELKFENGGNKNV